MSPIVPAIIPESGKHLEETLLRVATFAREVQIDIVDGQFVPFTSWPYTEHATINDLRTYAHGMVLEVDLMLTEPEKVISEYIEAGVRRVVVHLESTTRLHEVLAFKKQYDFKLGFSINNDTPLHILTDVIADCDYVQLMGIAHIGSQGQAFDERVLDRIVELRKEFPNLLISIDGSVNRETVARLAHAGASRCVAGSAILKAEHPEGAYADLLSLYTIAS